MKSPARGCAFWPRMDKDIEYLSCASETNASKQQGTPVVNVLYYGHKRKPRGQGYILISRVCAILYNSEEFQSFLGKPRPFDTNNTLSISLPKELFIDSPNRILICSLKLIYKVTINITFHYLLSNDIGLTATWPSYQGVGEYLSEETVVRFEPEVQKRRVDASYFDLIKIKDPLGNTVQQWRDVKTLEALNLFYILISDAAERRWTIVTRVGEEIEKIYFHVRHDFLPPLQAQVAVQREIKPVDVNVTFSVCASYSNGQAISGIYDAQLCICSL
ncbi:unnamed protein product [Hymenolepis diminuta]|uniref:Uncharacterized protein n=1 Tax=Hymenolepis diminuta TaxID=6216 RepID=A0A564Y915_HYMDI|nr:unnamed protein product [Hymenolepis diminuta]